MPDDIVAERSGLTDPSDRQSIRVLSDTPQAGSDDDSLDFLPYAQAPALLLSSECSGPCVTAWTHPGVGTPTRLGGLSSRRPLATSLFSGVAMTRTSRWQPLVIALAFIILVGIIFSVTMNKMSN